MINIINKYYKMMNKLIKKENKYTLSNIMIKMNIYNQKKYFVDNILYILFFIKNHS